MSQEGEFFTEDWEEQYETAMNQAKLENEQNTNNLNEKKKETLDDKIAMYNRLTPEQFQAKYLNKNIQPFHNQQEHFSKQQIDLQELSSTVSAKIKKSMEKEASEEHLGIFMEELSLYLYDQLHWQNYAEVAKKIVILKNQKKVEEKKLTKFKEKQKRQKKVEQQANPYSNRNKND